MNKSWGICLLCTSLMLNGSQSSPQKRRKALTYPVVKTSELQDGPKNQLSQSAPVAINIPARKKSPWDSSSSEEYQSISPTKTIKFDPQAKSPSQQAVSLGTYCQYNLGSYQSSPYFESLR